MIDIQALAKQAGYFLYDLTETHGIKTVESDAPDQWAQLEAFAALVLEAAAVECERIFNAPESEDGCGGWEAYYTRPYLHCAEAIRALKPKDAA
jgi:hypothetical protein